jgi:hypothetical protein
MQIHSLTPGVAAWTRVQKAMADTAETILATERAAAEQWRAQAEAGSNHAARVSAMREKLDAAVEEVAAATAEAEAAREEAAAAAVATEQRARRFVPSTC